MVSLIRLLLVWIGFLLLWLLFAFSVAAEELFFGAVAAAVTLFMTYVAFRAVPICFEPRMRWLAQVWRLPGMTVADLGLLMKHLVRSIAGKPSRSSFEAISFRSTDEHCRAAAQRALAILFVSTAPNSVVLDIDREKGEMFIHTLEPAPVPELVRKLEN